MLGRVPDAPSVVTSGCGLQVSYAMTSSRPECVTCLVFREHAHSEYLRFAEQVERLWHGPMPRVNVTGDQLSEAVERVTELAKRFSER
ncbi:hypothetical protein GCM10010411_08590 [Actinomadura fulvescens]|uniref:Uncharacterized protein n=1 Tax=Actinomadura fulvescens TaxID=46160 RepID=A0ABN3PCX0_9ACTN